MGSNGVNSLSGSRWVQSEVQTVAGEIAQAPISRGISQRKYQQLSKKLDNALKELRGIEAANVFARVQVEHLKEQVVKLYGDLEDGLLKREVSQIQEESSSLRRGRLTLKAIKTLEAHIDELEKNHLTLVPDRRVVADAKQALLEAKAKLSGGPVIRHFDLIAQQKNVRFVEESAFLPDEVEEFFDIARAVYNRDFRQAKARYAGLPGEHKRRIEEHVQSLMAILFEDPLETMQAVIATANELVGNGERYPTSQAIDQLFLGLSQFTAEEKPAGKIVSFKAH